ncbi:hypothetical protein, partial [Anabaenopsis arnoldii]|uniref:hypothetical protein n=1 Tax=Anabaenopsis arnoldii TaxID=2152938 RepID=UPI00232E1B05
MESVKQVIFILGNREQGTGNTGRIGKDWEGLGNTQKTIKFSPLPLQGQDLVDKVDKVTTGEKQYKVCILSKKNSPLKDHCPYKIFL